MDIPAVVMNPQDFRLIARPLALLADQFDIGEKLHLHGDRTVALAGIAAASRNIERKVPGAEAALLGLGQRGKEVTDPVEGLM